MFFKRSAVLPAAFVAAFQIASAQNISSACQSTLLNVAGSSDAECLNAGALVTLALQGSSESVIGPINSWLQGLCSIGPCSNETLAAIVSNITSGCSTDLSGLIGSTTTDQITTVVQEVYPTVRDIVCLEDTSDNNQLCVTQTLTNIETTTGTLTLSEIQSLLDTSAAGGTVDLPQNTTCTSCIKEAYNIAYTDFPGYLGNISDDAQNVCGADFINGSAQPYIVQTASNDSTFSAGSDVGGTSQFSGFANMLSLVVVGSMVFGALVI